MLHGLSSTTSKRTNKELSRSLPVLSNEVFVLVFLILKKGEGQRICFFSWIGCPSRRKLVLHASPFPLKYDPPASRYDTFPRATQSPCSMIHLLWRTTHFPVRPSFLEACSICLEARHISISAIQLTDNHLQSEQRLPLLCLDDFLFSYPTVVASIKWMKSVITEFFWYILCLLFQCSFCSLECINKVFSLTLR